MREAVLPPPYTAATSLARAWLTDRRYTGGQQPSLSGTIHLQKMDQFLHHAVRPTTTLAAADRVKTARGDGRLLIRESVRSDGWLLAKKTRAASQIVHSCGLQPRMALLDLSCAASTAESLTGSRSRHVTSTDSLAASQAPFDRCFNVAACRPPRRLFFLLSLSRSYP